MNKYVFRIITISIFALTLIPSAISQPAYALPQPEIKQTSITPTLIPTPTADPIMARLITIEDEIGSFDRILEIQSNSFDATVSRMESNMNLLLAIAAIASVFIAILGLGFTRIWIRKLIGDQIQNTTSQEMDRIIREEIHRIREEWDPKFADMYEEYRNVNRKD